MDGLPVRRAADVLAGLLLAVTALLLVYQSRYFPEINPDESGAYLGLQLLRGRFSFPIDPSGPGDIRYYFFDCYPPVYYLFNALIFKLSGFGIVQARSVTVLFMVAAGALCYSVVRRGAGAAAGLLALAVFLHIVPTRLYNWIVNRPDIAAHFFTLAALALLFPPQTSPCIKNRTVRGLAVGLLYSLAVQSHYIALLAGPVVGAAVLWRAAWQPWSSRFAWGALIGLVGGWVPFLWAAWPYRDSIIDGLLGYGVSVTLAERVTTHIRMLAGNFEVIAFGLGPVVVGVAVLGSIVSRIRGEAYAWALASSLIFALVSLYPNNSLVWYYGLTYVYAGIVAAGLTVGAWLPRRGAVAALILILSAGFALEKIAYLTYRVDQRVRSASGITVAQSFDALAADADVLGGPTLAPIHFVFSVVQDHVLNPWSVVNLGGEFQIRPELAKAVPELPPLSAYRAGLLDHGRNTYDANGLLAHAREWRSGAEPHPLETMSGASLWVSRRFGLRKVMADSGHGSGNWSLWAGAPDNGAFQWPAMEMVEPEGAVSLRAGSSCSVGPAMLERMSGPLPLWRLRFAVSFPGPTQPLAVHAELESGTPTATHPPLGLFAFYPSRAGADIGWASLRDKGVYPFLSAEPQNRIATIAPAGRPGAEVTSVVLPGPAAPTEPGIIDIMTIEPARLVRLEVAWLGTGSGGGACTDAGRPVVQGQ